MSDLAYRRRLSVLRDGPKLVKERLTGLHRGTHLLAADAERASDEEIPLAIWIGEVRHPVLVHASRDLQTDGESLSLIGRGLDTSVRLQVLTALVCRDELGRVGTDPVAMRSPREREVALGVRVRKARLTVRAHAPGVGNVLRVVGRAGRVLSCRRKGRRGCRRPEACDPRRGRAAATGRGETGDRYERKRGETCPPQSRSSSLVGSVCAVHPRLIIRHSR
jgi:hypothetical protein